MRGLGLIIILISLVIGTYITVQNLGGETGNRVERGRDTGGDAVAQSALTSALNGSRSLVVDGETESFTAADLAKSDPTYRAGTGTEQAGPSADPQAISVMYDRTTLTLCNASTSGNAFCIRSAGGQTTYSQAPGSVAAAKAAPFVAQWSASAPPVRNAAESPENAAERLTQGLNP